MRGGLETTRLIARVRSREDIDASLRDDETTTPRGTIDFVNESRRYIVIAVTIIIGVVVVVVVEEVRLIDCKPAYRDSFAKQAEINVPNGSVANARRPERRKRRWTEYHVHRARRLPLAAYERAYNENRRRRKRRRPERGFALGRETRSGARKSARVSERGRDPGDFVPVSPCKSKRARRRDLLGIHRSVSWDRFCGHWSVFIEAHEPFSRKQHQENKDSRPNFNFFLVNTKLLVGRFDEFHLTFAVRVTRHALPCLCV